MRGVYAFILFIPALAGAVVALSASPVLSQGSPFRVARQEPPPLTVSPSFAGSSPWLPTPGVGNVTVSYTYQTADEYYRKTSPGSSVKNVPTPGGEDLQQHTVWIDMLYGWSDEIALDARLGYAQSHMAAGSIDERSPEGLADVNLGITYRLLDEAMSESDLLPSLALRVGGIIAGDYDTGAINALGDGGDGFEVSGLAGKFFADRFALSAEFGYRNRNNKVPDNLFLKLSGGALLWNRVGLSLSYERVDTPWGSLDIGPGEAPGVFSPARFPEVKEELELLGGSLSVALTDQISLGLSYATVINGRNTAASDVFGVSLAYSFDTWAF